MTNRYGQFGELHVFSLDVMLFLHELVNHRRLILNRTVTGRILRSPEDTGCTMFSICTT